MFLKLILILNIEVTGCSADHLAAYTAKYVPLSVHVTYVTTAVFEQPVNPTCNNMLSQYLKPRDKTCRRPQ